LNDLCQKGEEVRELGEFVIKRRKNVRIHELLSNTTAYAHNLNVMLGVTRNSVVQQHLRVVQELQLLSLVVLSYYYHEMNFGKRSIKKPPEGGLAMLHTPCCIARAVVRSLILRAPYSTQPPLWRETSRHKVIKFFHFGVVFF
jgi:hypothetical protein